MEFVEHFGINWILIAAQIVNFLIILYVLKRFLYKPLFAVFKKREEIVKESIKNAEEAKKALDKAELQEKEIIKKAQQTANQIIKDAKDQAAVIATETEEATKKKTERMIQDAKTQIERETRAAEKELSDSVSQLSVKILKKSLENVFTDKDQEVIVQKAVKEIGARSK